jgi:heptosyltransferase-2
LHDSFHAASCTRIVALDSRTSAVVPARKPKLLVLEFWGLGDLIFATSILPAALDRYAVTLLAKPHALLLLRPTFPDVTFLAYDPPWSAYRDKYKFSRWKWPELGARLGEMRAANFDAAISVRSDPRDHLMMWLGGARARYGFPTKGSGLLLTHRLQRSMTKQHRVEDWRDVGRALGLAGMEAAEPKLNHPAYHSNEIDRLLEGVEKPIVCLHTGARLWARRWPESSFASLINKMRAHYDFHLVLIPDPDGYGKGLSPLAQTFVPGVTTPEMVDLLGRADLLLCNDSGPAHIAAACGKPVIPIFGPTDPDWFFPWGNRQHVVIRDICPWRPCFDYCKFSEPHCLTKLSPEIAWPEVHAHIERLIAGAAFPMTLRRSTVSDRQLA